jgi:hypothetical protein
MLTLGKQLIASEQLSADLEGVTEWQMTIQPGVYTWTIFDAAGNEICCSFGTGSYVAEPAADSFSSACCARPVCEHTHVLTSPNTASPGDAPSLQPHLSPSLPARRSASGTRSPCAARRSQRAVSLAPLSPSCSQLACPRLRRARHRRRLRRHRRRLLRFRRSFPHLPHHRHQTYHGQSSHRCRRPRRPRTPFPPLSPPSAPFELRIEISPDCFPEDTSWQLAREGEVLESAQLVAGQGPSTWQFELPPRCYEFHIADASGDGIC